MKTRNLIISSLLVFTIFSCKTGIKNAKNSSSSVVQGKVVFENNCAACHNFESDGMGPNLAGITRELNVDEISAFISNPIQVIESGNERAVRLQKKYKTIMPSYNSLGKEKIASLVAYLNTYKDIVKPREIMEEGILDDPISKKVVKADFILNLENAFQIPASSEELPYTRITKLVSQPTTGHIYICDINGKMYRVKNKKPEAYLDMQAFMPNFKQKSGWATGFGSFAFHPNFSENGLFYTTHSEPAHSELADYALPEKVKVTLQWVVQEWKTENPFDFPFKGTHRELFRIDMATQAHGMQNIDFNSSAKKGDQDFGNLYIGIGDGGAVERKFPEIANGKHPWGSILRIDPSGNNSSNGKYGIPKDNLFANIDGAKEVYANGFRNPHRFSWTPEGKLISANIGQHNIESVFVVKPGANHGWPKREGTFGINTAESVHKIYKLNAEEMNDGVTYPTLEYDHDEGNAVCGGFVYTGKRIPGLTGKYIFGDIVNGRLFYAEESEMEAGKMMEFKEVPIAYKKNVTSLLELSNSGHAKLRIGQDSDGEMYLFSMNDGKVYRFSNIISSTKR